MPLLLFLPLYSIAFNRKIPAIGVEETLSQLQLETMFDRCCYRELISLCMADVIDEVLGDIRGNLLYCITD